MLTACVSTVSDYQSPTTGVNLQLTPQLGGALLAVRRANVYIAEEVTSCGFETQGVVRNADLPRSIAVAPGKTYNLRTVFETVGRQIDGTVVVDHLFEPKPGARYELRMTSNRDGHIVHLLENGRVLPLRRPCLTNTTSAYGREQSAK
ncbi:hypothetical protein [Aliiroseovarius crassostreae]|uniref:hypothetical protein n=1 Tax=Aliiroseovarius crassostreae TaxID=154981 RepID=UPI002203D287|nr:hypothetical protein [Aliiroseovarius crassostreae]UWP97357.1 hypothetical protein K3X53_07975 [Aliiroseovarius crassostreae]